MDIGSYSSTCREELEKTMILHLYIHHKPKLEKLHQLTLIYINASTQYSHPHLASNNKK